MPSGDYNLIKTECPKGHPYDESNTARDADGHRRCRACIKIYQVSMGKKYANEKSKRWSINNPQKIKERDRKQNLKKFGLTTLDYDEMLARQGGVCAICKKNCKSGDRLAVDHCHSTNAVRGLLCGNCNIGLGSFRDDPVRMSSAVNYLFAHSGTSIPTLILS